MFEENIKVFGELIMYELFFSIITDKIIFDKFTLDLLSLLPLIG